MAGTALIIISPSRIPGETVVDPGMVDITYPGGASVPYYLEDAEVRSQFAEMIKAEGTENRMDKKFYDKNTTYSFAGG